MISPCSSKKYCTTAAFITRVIGQQPTSRWWQFMSKPPPFGNPFCQKIKREPTWREVWTWKSFVDVTAACSILFLVLRQNLEFIVWGHNLEQELCWIWVHFYVSAKNKIHHKECHFNIIHWNVKLKLIGLNTLFKSLDIERGPGKQISQSFLESTK